MVYHLSSPDGYGAIISYCLEAVQIILLLAGSMLMSDTNLMIARAEMFVTKCEIQQKEISSLAIFCLVIL